MYKCKKCGKESHYKSSLTCSKCMRPTTASYSDPDIITISALEGWQQAIRTDFESSQPSSDYSGGGGDFGGGGASGDF